MRHRHTNLIKQLQSATNLIVMESSLSTAIRSSIQDWARLSEKCEIEIENASTTLIESGIEILCKVLCRPALLVLIGSPDDGFTALIRPESLNVTVRLILENDEPLSVVSFGLEFACTIDLSERDTVGGEGTLLIRMIGKEARSLLDKLQNAEPRFGA